MFESLIDTPQRTASLGARQHALLLNSNPDAGLKALKRDNWTCHVCGTRLVGLMEVDHLKGHKLCGSDGLAAICQFCHDLKHPVWSLTQRWFEPRDIEVENDRASERKLSRSVLIYAPDITQNEISRMSWAALIDRGAGFTSGPLIDALSERADKAIDFLNVEDPAAIVEVILKLRDDRGEAAARAICKKIDKVIRVVPGALFHDRGLVKWTSSGFKTIDLDVLAASLPQKDPDGSTLIAAARALSA